MSNKLYGVGVGPGDPELLTLKAVRIINESKYIMVPDPKSGRQVALKTCEAYLKDKEILHVNTPMTYHKKTLQESYKNIANQVVSLLKTGENVAFLTIGDPSIYSTYTYIEQLVREMGFEAQTVPGIPSFCAAASAAGISLCERNELLHIVPASYEEQGKTCLSGNIVYMKSGKKLEKLLGSLKEQNKLKDSILVENAGMENQRVLRDLSHLENNINYLSLVITKEKQ